MKFLISILLFSSFAEAGLVDSLNTKKNRKYSFETGINTAFFISTKVHNNFKNEFLLFPFIMNMGIGYQRNDNYKTIISYTVYGNEFKQKYIGDIAFIGFINVSFGLQKKLIQKKKFQYYQLASLNWRAGYEEIFLGNYFSEGLYEKSIYNSPGIGFGNGLSYKIAKGTTLGIDLGYYHFFEKSRLENPKAMPNHRPVRNLLISNFKFSFLL